MTLRDLNELCDRYVPQASRHPNSKEYAASAWWCAHEIGHLLTAPAGGVGRPMFGLDEDSTFDDGELKSFELAAMDVSRRLLAAVGRSDLAGLEEEETDYRTMTHDDGRSREILRERQCLRLPSDRRGLVRKIRRVLRRAINCATP